MHFKTLALVLGLAGSAHAANISFKLPTVIGNIAPLAMPGVSIIPMSLPTVDAMIAAPALAPALIASALPTPAPVSLPVLPAAAIGQARLPGVPSPLPLPTPASLSAARRPAPMIIERFSIESLLDDKLADEAASAMVPGSRVELNELRDAAVGRDPIRTPENLFDGRREKHRDLELPSNKYF